MKKTYSTISRNLLVAAALISSTVLSAQQRDVPLPVNGTHAPQPQVNAIGDNGQPHAYGTTTSGAQGGGCDSLLTTLAMGNANSGVMFDVVPSTDVNITFLDALLEGNAGQVYVYHHAGTHVGTETNAAAWTLFDSVYVNVTTQDSLYRVPLYMGYPVLAGDTEAFYLTGSVNVGVAYTNGTAVGNVAAQDPAMKVLEGTGMSWPFGTMFTPRVFNGIVNYCVAGFEPCLNTTTTYMGGNGFDGNMFDVVSSHDITISGFSGNINGSGPMAIYYHSGTYVGTETNPGAWTLIDSVNVTSAGVNVPTTIPFTGTLTMPAGSTYAFYITGTGGGADVNYTNGTAVGNVFTSDGIIDIKEGQGCGYGFTMGATPRAWNGTISYCVGITGIEENANEATSTIYPNPVSGTATLTVGGQPLQHAIVQVTDVTGRVVNTIENVNGNTVEINAADMSSGMYFYNVIQNGQAVSNGKFIVE